MEQRPTVGRQERVGWEAQARAAAAMGRMNAQAAELVEVIVDVLAAEAWGAGGGLRSPEHWVTWRTGVSSARAKRLVQIARRVADLPVCMGLFRTGGLSEDAMGLIAAKAPAERDRELAELGPMLLHTQLARILAHLPDQAPRPDRPGPAREVRCGFRPDGWWEGHQVLPPDEGAIAQRALESARSTLFQERDADADPAVAGPVTWADGFLRMAEEALDALDPATRRGDARGERAQILVHLDAHSDGDGSARIHLGPQLPDSLRRYLCCDAKVRAVIEDQTGAVLGISPLAPTVNPRLRPVIEQRDGGCRYPGCGQRRWVHIHHLRHREHGGLTVAGNLLSLCPFHHRLHHLGAFEISGNPEQPHGLRFVDHWGHDIGPPRYGPPAPPAYGTPPQFTPPTGERLTRWFSWN